MQLGKSLPALRMVTLSPHHRHRSAYRHRHLFYELGLVQGGRCLWRMGKGHRALLQSGEAILIKPGTLHWEEIAPTEQAGLAWLGFDLDGPPPAWCQRVIALGDDAPEVASQIQAISRERHLNDARSGARINFALQSLLLLLDRCAEGSRLPLAVHSNLNPRQTQIVESAAHYFRHNFQNPLSIAQVAAYHSLCPAHFSTLFRRHHLITPRGFLRQARLQRAADLLAGSELSLKEIAAQCGFVDAAHFSKSFKQERCMTPRHFRLQTRQPRPRVMC